MENQPSQVDRMKKLLEEAEQMWLLENGWGQDWHFTAKNIRAFTEAYARTHFNSVISKLAELSKDVD